jgi:hypothetical protein
MKLFNTIQELWDYCAYCPICMRNCREVIVSVGPDGAFILVSSQKKDNNLFLQCTYKNKHSIYTVEYNLNCTDNTFLVEVPNVIELPLGETAKPQKIKEAYFFFFVEGICNECNCATAHSLDLELDIVDKQISKIGLERESFYLLEGKDKFHVTPIHDRNVMLVSRCHVDDEQFGFSESNKTIELPLVKLDLSDQEKATNKIKTLILFS